MDLDTYTVSMSMGKQTRDRPPTMWVPTVDHIVLEQCLSRLGPGEHGDGARQRLLQPEHAVNGNRVQIRPAGALFSCRV
jgi:hypothetical protein